MKKMKHVLLVFVLSTLTLAGQTITLTNTSNSAISPDFVYNDTFALHITGAAANSTVVLNATVNGVPDSPWTAGTTDGSGNFALTGQETSGYIGVYVQTWSVGGTQVGSPIDFQVIDQPTGLTLTSEPLVSPPSSLGCPNPYYGIFGDWGYQITGAYGNITTSAILLEPYEFVTFYYGTIYAQNEYSDIGPVSGYSDSGKYATSGVFHDVPFGSCGVGVYSTQTEQNIVIIIGDSEYSVRTQVFTENGTSSGHGNEYNDFGDISVSR